MHRLGMVLSLAGLVAACAGGASDTVESSTSSIAITTSAVETIAAPQTTSEAMTTSCLTCQARHAAMSRTARELTGIGDVKVKAPADLEWRVMSSLEGDLAMPRSWRTPVAVPGSIGVDGRSIGHL